MLKQVTCFAKIFLLYKISYLNVSFRSLFLGLRRRLTMKSLCFWSCNICQMRSWNTSWWRQWWRQLWKRNWPNLHGASTLFEWSGP